MKKSFGKLTSVMSHLTHFTTQKAKTASAKSVQIAFRNFDIFDLILIFFRKFPSSLLLTRMKSVFLA